MKFIFGNSSSTYYVHFFHIGVGGQNVFDVGQFLIYLKIDRGVTSYFFLVTAFFQSGVHHGLPLCPVHLF